jgi:amylosucrase
MARRTETEAPAKGKKAKPDPLFALRWRRALRDLEGPLARLYPDHPDLAERIRAVAAAASAARPAALRELDLLRDVDPDWFLSQEMVAYVAYVDRFAGRLAEVPRHLAYLRSLGVTYLHFMPLLQPRPGPSDGGYAVMDYGAVDPRLGSLDDLEAVTKAARAEGISVCVDLVVNHTAAEHPWAVAARAGDPRFQAFYRMFDTDEVPKQYERTLIEIFPDQAPGSFTWNPDVKPAGKWVWTTFNTYQWDLDWSNPEVFLAMLEAILLLANRGVEVFRLDAVAFMWKRMGTTCQNLPEVHDLLQATVQATRAAAPAVIHKAEAIVSPRELVPYLGQGGHEGRVCQLAYHNNLMVQFWSAIASRDARLMTHVMKTHFPEIVRRASFATYLRCHDDIGWAITDEDAAAITHMDAWNHRNFLADFYNGSFPGSFARGADFQSNPETGDRRTNGSLASLAGLEAALEAGDASRVDDAVARILMGHALIASHGGIPLLYMGDELGMLNDPSYLADPDLADDGRWMHRPFMDWDRLARAEAEPRSPEGRILAGVRHIMARRKAVPAFAAWIRTRVLETGHPALYAYQRPAEGAPVTCVVNVTEREQRLPLWSLGLSGPLHDLLAERPAPVEGDALLLKPYAALWLSAG